MSHPEFPDRNVSEYIISLAQEFDLDIVDRKYFHHKEMDEFLSRFGADKWSWELARKGSLVTLHLSVYFPDYMPSISFENSMPEVKEKARSHFIFEKYLSQHLRDRGEVDTLAKIASERSWKENWHVPFEILKSHLAQDLEPIIAGREWPNIEFRLEDYIEPEALDRMYEDGLKILDEDTAGKKTGAWVYFLDFFRKK